MAKTPPPRPLCMGLTKAGQPCQYTCIKDRPWCLMHDPELAAKRKANGRIRHPQTQDIAGEIVEGGRKRTLAGAVNRLFDIADAIEANTMPPETGKVAIAALKAARDALQWDYEQKHPRRPAKESPFNIPPDSPDPIRDMLVGRRQ